MFDLDHYKKYGFSKGAEDQPFFGGIDPARLPQSVGDLSQFLSATGYDPNTGKSTPPEPFTGPVFNGPGLRGGGQMGSIMAPSQSQPPMPPPPPMQPPPMQNPGAQPMQQQPMQQQPMQFGQGFQPMQQPQMPQMPDWQNIKSRGGVMGQGGQDWASLEDAKWR